MLWEDIATLGRCSPGCGLVRCSPGCGLLRCSPLVQCHPRCGLVLCSPGCDLGPEFDLETARYSALPKSATCWLHCIGLLRL